MGFFNRPKPIPGWAQELQNGINSIMAAVEVDQTALDTLATNLEAVKTSLAAEIASLQTQLPEADLTGLNAALTDLQGLEPPAPAPSP
jgi:hypothetical protein